MLSMEVFIFYLLLGFSIAATSNKSEELQCGTNPDPGYVYYFAYGSNLLPSRMHIECASARSCYAAVLKGWRLDFNSLPKLEVWNGSVATIVEDDHFDVMGNIWQIKNTESDKLDEQEGVSLNWYKNVNVTVKMLTGATVNARTYVMQNQPPKVEPENIPPQRQPSRTYFQVILFGAIESRVPVIHIEYIQRFPNNGKLARKDRRKALGYPFYDDTFN